MNGLLQMEQGSPVPAEQTQAPSQQPASDQDKYDLVAGLMVKHVYEKADAIIDTLQRDQNLSQAMGVMLSNMMIFSLKMAEQNQQQVPPRMLFQATVETARAIGELLIDRQLVPEQQEAQVTEEAFYTALDLFGQRVTLTDEERQQYVEVMDEFQQLGSSEQPGQEVSHGPAQ